MTRNNKIYNAVGLMSGTSLDGVDCALIRTDGHDFVEPAGFISIPYTAEDRAVIRPAFGIKDRADRALKAAERLVTIRHAEAVQALLRREGIEAAAVDLIGFHGQTVYHAPKDGITIQIGDGANLAAATGIDVVYDFRSNDVRQGGEGAPLAPLYHAARIKSAGLDLPVAILNIGGVANVTWIGPGANDIMAFDTGPGNALIDDWVKTRTGALFDKDGMMASSGRADGACVAQWLEHPYFRRVPPKSLDRDQWDIAALGRLTRTMDEMSDADGAATLMRFTVEAIVKSVEFMPAVPKQWYACGGGRRNRAMMEGLAARLREPGYGVLHMVEDLGWDGDATEAECFAYLGVRSVLGLPLSLPGTTGVKEAVTGGVFIPSP